MTIKEVKQKIGLMLKSIDAEGEYNDMDLLDDLRRLYTELNEQ